MDKTPLQVLEESLPIMPIKNRYELANPTSNKWRILRPLNRDGFMNKVSVDYNKTSDYWLLNTAPINLSEEKYEAQKALIDEIGWNTLENLNNSYSKKEQEATEILKEDIKKAQEVKLEDAKLKEMATGKPARTVLNKDGEKRDPETVALEAYKASYLKQDIPQNGQPFYVELSWWNIVAYRIMDWKIYEFNLSDGSLDDYTIYWSLRPKEYPATEKNLELIEDAFQRRDLNRLNRRWIYKNTIQVSYPKKINLSK